MKNIEETLEYLEKQEKQAYEDLEEMQASSCFNESDIRRQGAIWAVLKDAIDFIKGEN